MTNKNKPATKFFQNEVDDYKKEFYESGYRTFMSVRLDRFLEEINKLSLPVGSKFLDAGCGPGYMTKAFHDKGYITSALDSSPEMLRLTKLQFELTPEADMPEFVEGDIENLPFEDGTFDLVASAGVIEYLSDDKKVLDDFNRILKPGGYIILSSTSKYSPIGFFEPIIEAIKRNRLTRNSCNWILKKIGGTPVRPRDFTVRKHTAQSFVRNAKNSNFKIQHIGFFYGLPWPHPFDRIFPKITNYLGKKIEKFSHTPLRHTFEGIYIVAQKQ